MALSLTIEVDEIGETGKAVVGELPAEWLGDSLLEPYTPQSPVALELEVTRVGEDNVLARGTVGFDVSFEDSRTLEPGASHVDVKITEMFQPASKRKANLGEGVDAGDLEDEIRTFEGRRIDLEPMLRECIVLAQDPYPVVGDRPESDEDADEPLWTSDKGEIDPRWAKLQEIDLS